MSEIYDFGIVLRDLRKKKGLTQTELGAILNLSKTAVSKYESNIASPPLDILRKLARTFDVPLDYLCGTEQREKISVYNLTTEQVRIVDKLVTVFREHNKVTNSKISPECCMLLGEIVAELVK